ncbi:MAG: hypothetical protein JXR49_15460 [Acidobacteria bacterium]|nr:hypothetical protein [Acidobacteriota bacterium]
MQFSRWLSALFITAGLCGYSPVFAADADSAELLETADAVVKTVEQLRGLDFKESVRKEVKDRAEIASYLKGRIREEYSQDALQKEGKMLGKLGLIPSTIDYRDYILKLLTERIEGKYDEKKKVLNLASWLSVEEQIPVMVQQLARALQDQHFNIRRIIEDEGAKHNNDRALALKALLEGDGMVVTLQYVLEQSRPKRHFSELPDLASVMQFQMASMQAQSAVFREAPAYIQQTLVFPYGYGASFLQNAWKVASGWQSVNAVYFDLPASTEQIMHPDKYFGIRDDPLPVTPLDPIARLGSDWKIAYRNVLGEFSLGLLLNLNLTEEHARKSVTGWGGDEAMHLEDGAGRDAVFVNTIWDTEESAGKFYLAMEEWFGKRYPDGKTEGESSTALSLVHDGEYHGMQREGRNIYFMIGLPESERRSWEGD